MFSPSSTVCWLIFDDAPQRVDGAPPQPAPTAVLDGTGQTFEDVEVARMAANDPAIATERSHECCATPGFPGTRRPEVTGPQPTRPKATPD